MPRVVLLAIVPAVAAAGLAVSLVLADGPAPRPRPAQAAEPLPPPASRLPGSVPGLARGLHETTVRLRAAIDAWTRAGTQATSARVPTDVELLALHHQRLVLRLVRDPSLTRRVLRRLPASVRGEARDTVAARRALLSIPHGRPAREPRIRLGPAEPPGRLRRHYLEAQRRFGVRWELLAAVNLVESAFGRLRNASSAGAHGPMQFVPATWRAYGLGGAIDDPRDAILGAANYLRASGARGNERAALLRYNHSTAYARAVLLHARRIAREPRHLLALYAWPVYIRRDGRTRRVTGPGLPEAPRR
jgi:hypothetical protein